ncbi:Polysulphide reductase, NrfD [Acididesulfobacillus acetoxydans]|uniref:Polysulfide reductase NrfD n=1 Tax=Acididesulfobacillus acetoxydans TaxID=1561005 RepID=A0A8S0WH63_9FIRM|nr:NrfD/PsrC family molybdoenzyme membrane anchor subunit [Acididesulfobacillus acetoxydans]CAA7602472.1 Polysulphide reductase, NrfD [Acididesulfobacillus acetoxydans]CEJ05927.1 Polysulfide reductase NrfD [Acididesulfobacillus acetoxydans]
MDITWGAGAANPVIWGWLIAVYLFLAGIAGGAFLTASLTDLFKKNGQARVIRSGAFLAPVAIIVGLGLLVFDLGRPLSFWKLIFNVNFGSVMSIGVFIISIFTVLSLLYAYLVWTSVKVGSKVQVRVGRAANETAATKAAGTVGGRGIVAFLGALFALGTATYTGFLLSAVSTNVFWSTHLPGIAGVPFLPFLFLVSALSTGLAATLLGAGTCDDLTVYKKIDIVLIVIEILLVAVLYASVRAVFFSGNLAALFWLGVVMIGLILPLLLSLYGVSRHKNLVLPSCSLVVIGGLALRCFVVYAGQLFK